MAWANIALGIALMVWAIVSTGMLLTGFGLPFPGSEASLGFLLAWAILNYRNHP